MKTDLRAKPIVIFWYNVPKSVFRVTCRLFPALIKMQESICTFSNFKSFAQKIESFHVKKVHSILENFRICKRYFFILEQVLSKKYHFITLEYFEIAKTIFGPQLEHSWGEIQKFCWFPNQSVFFSAIF